MPFDILKRNEKALECLPCIANTENLDKQQIIGIQEAKKWIPSDFIKECT